MLGVEGLAMSPHTLDILDGVASQNLSTLPPPKARIHSYLTESVHQVVLQRPISAKSRHLILCISNDEKHVDGFVAELTFAKRPEKHFV